MLLTVVSHHSLPHPVELTGADKLFAGCTRMVFPYPSCSVTVVLIVCLHAVQVLSLPTQAWWEWSGAEHFPKCCDQQLHAAG